MSITRHDQSAILSLAVEHGNTVYLAGVVAKWLNKTGISAKNREEAAFLFYGATILLHGRRMRAHLDAIIDEDRAEREKSEKAKEPAPAATSILPLVATPAKARAA